jgi:hypothetical protein
MPPSQQRKKNKNYKVRFLFIYLFYWLLSILNSASVSDAQAYTQLANFVHSKKKKKKKLANFVLYIWVV